MSDLRDQFDRDGFVIVREVLTQDEVQKLRALFLGVFDGGVKYEGDATFVRHDICSRYPETRFLLWHPKVVSTLREILGEDFVFLPEMSAHNAFFSNWHKDVDSPEAAGKDWVWAPDYRMVEAAFYLQDNGDHGGGLDIVPGSHRFHPTSWGERRKQKKMRRKDFHSIPSRAGDMVVFNFQADHRATRPKQGKLEADKRKLALFLACSANNEHAARYREFLEARDDYVYLKGHEYPEELRELAREKDLTFS
jgi:ectoine hydroxylase-related dioxygenase (phytanoyl-CoA dioxygenase family)